MIPVPVQRASVIEFIAAIPITSLSGTIGHPDTVEYLRKIRESEGGGFVYALVTQKLGDPEGEEAIHSKYDRDRNRLA